MIAYKKIMDLYEKYKIPELTPALLAISDKTLERLLYKPFNYVFTSGVYRWDKSQADWSFDEEVKSGSVNLDNLEFLCRDDLKFPYKDMVLFLNGDFLQVVSQYPNSIVSDASLYAKIKNSLLNQDYESAVEYADEFTRRYPKHRHLDDATALKVIAYEVSGEPLAAFDTAWQGRQLPDGDMRDWFEEEQFQITERFMNSKQFEMLIKKYHDSPLLGNLMYTFAHHLMVEGKYEEANYQLRKLKDYLHKGKTRLINPFFGGKISVNIDADIENTTTLLALHRDKSLLGIYNLGLYYYHNELAYYNQLHVGFRRSCDKEQ